MKFGNSASNLLGIDLDKGRLTVAAPGLAITPPNVEAGQVTYPSVATDTDLRYRMASSGVKQEFVLRSAQSPTSYTFHLSDPAHQLGTATRQKNGGYSFDAVIDSGLHLTIPPAVAYQDSVGDDTGSAVQDKGSGHLTVQPKGDGFDVTVSIDSVWLQGKTFPVILDPTISFNDADSTLVYNGWAYKTGTNGSTDGTFVNNDGLLNVGTYTDTNLDVRPARSFLKFDVSKVPAGSLLNSAILGAYYGDCVGYNPNHVNHTSIGTNYCPNNSYTVEAHSMTHSWSPSDTPTSLWSWMGPTIISNTIPAGPVPQEYQPAQKTFDIKNEVYNWINNAATNNGVQLKLSSEPLTGSIGGPAFASSRNGYGFRPSLSISYTPPASPPQTIVATPFQGSAAVMRWSPGLGDDQLQNVLSYDVVIRLAVSPFTVISGPVNYLPTATPLTYVPGLVDGQLYQFGVRTNFATGSSNYAYSNVIKVGASPYANVSTSPAGTVGRGQLVTYTITPQGSSTGNQTITSLVETVPAGMTVIPGSFTFQRYTANPSNQSPADPLPVGCTTVSALTCTLSGSTITVGGLPSLTGTAQHTISFQAIAVGNDRRCSAALDQLSVANAAGTGLGMTPPINICDTGLGLENWWSYVSRDIGPQGTAAVNVANGNLVVQHTDSTPIQAHGSLGYVLRRTYNSQDSATLSLPGNFGKGWTLNVSEVGDVAGNGIGATQLYVPSVSSILNFNSTTIPAPVPVTLIDRDGTRHVFTPKIALGAGALDVTNLVGAPVAATRKELVPTLLGANIVGLNTANPAYRICVDEPYTAPAGVHLGLFRYIRIAGSSTCAAPSTPVLLGFAAVRPDRVRYEFAFTGQLVSMTDANGVELRYLYDGAPTLGGQVFPTAPAATSIGKLTTIYEPRSCSGDPTVAPTSGQLECRAFRFTYPNANEIDVADPSAQFGSFATGRAPTRYLFDTATPRHLITVINPDDATGATDRLNYTYGACGGSAQGVDQLCSVTDPVGDPTGRATTFTYETAPWGIPRLKSIVDRRANATTFGYETANYVHADEGNHRSRFENIDSVGRVSTVSEGDTSDIYQHQYQYFWDNPAPCRQPSAVNDNNLCERIRRSLQTSNGTQQAGFSQDEDIRYVYNDEGRLLRERRINNGGTNVDTTYGYTAQYFEANSTAAVTYTDSVAGSGNVTSTVVGVPRSDNNTLFAVTDQTQMLTPRGNQAGAGYASYLTAYRVDNNAAVSPGVTPGGNTCTDPANPSANTGNRCQVDAPAATGFVPGATGCAADPAARANGYSCTRYTYDTFGQRLTMLTPKAQAAGSTNTYSYSYYADTDKDLGGYGSAGGWLKTVSDPSGSFVAFAYDHAGNMTRTWDRNATAGHLTTDAWGGSTAPTGSYSETLHAPTGANQYSVTWRVVKSASNQLQQATTYTLDANGNQLSIRTPKGNQTDQTFDSNDNLATMLTPQEKLDGKAAWQYGYDAFDNRIKETDPRGAVRTYSYDAVNRLAVASYDNGPVTATNAKPTGCNLAVAGDPNFPVGDIVCFTSYGYDGEDNLIISQDGNGEDQLYAYDGLGQRVTTTTPRFDGTFTSLVSTNAYDADGNVTDVCSPRQYATGDGGWSTTPPVRACDSTATFARHMTYDLSGRVVTSKTNRTAGGETTTYLYDGDGNVVSTTPPNNTVDPTNNPATTATFDLMDRKLTQTVPRSSSVSFPTTYTYLPSGDLASVTSPASLANKVTAYSYDAAHRLKDTVVGADNTSVDAAGYADAPANTKNVRTRNLYDPDGNLAATVDARAFACKTPPCTTLPIPTPASTPYMTTTNVDADGRPTAMFAPRLDPTAVYDAVGAPDAGLSSEQTSQCSTSNRPAAVTSVPTYPSTTGVCVTKRAYDQIGNVTQLTLPTSNGADNRKVLYSYAPDSLLMSADTPSAKTAGSRAPLTTFGYDGAGREVLRSLPDITTPSARYQSTVYNSDGTARMVTVSGLLHNTRYSYDANGNTTSVLDAAGFTTNAAYFADDRLQTISDPLVTGQTTRNTTTYGYDNNGNVTSVLSPSGNAHDGTNPQGLPTANSYTADNLLAKTKVPVDATSATATAQRLRRLTYTYDGSGRKLTEGVDMVDGTAGEAVTQAGGTRTSTWNPNDHLASETPWAGTGNHTFTYDPLGNVFQATDTTNGSSSTSTNYYYLDGRPRMLGDGTESTNYSYDGAGTIAGRKQITNAGATQITSYVHNDADLVQSMSSDVGGATATQYTYDDAGRVDTETDPNLQYTKNFWNQEDTLQRKELRQAQGAGTDLANWVYNYDALNRQLDVTFNGVDATGTTVSAGPTTKFAYTYDEAGHVKSYTPGTNAQQTYVYDHDGTRTTTPQGTFTYNADDSIKTSPIGPAGTYSYDPAGNLTNDQCRTYTYDGFNRTTQAGASAGASGCGTTAQVTYLSDVFNRQRSLTTAGATTAFHYDGLNAAVASEDVGTPATEVFYGLDANSAPKAVKTGTAGTPSFLTDNGRDVTTLTSTSGSVTCTARYDPPGAPVSNTGGTIAGANKPCNTATSTPVNDVFYAGARRDKTTGDYQLGARTYDPTKASFTTADSATTSSPRVSPSVGIDPLTRNTYSYVNGDPINLVDPTGHGIPCDLEFHGDLAGRRECVAQNRRAAEASRFADAVKDYTDFRLGVLLPLSVHQLPKDKYIKGRAFSDEEKQQIYGVTDACLNQASFASACGFTAIDVDNIVNGRGLGKLRGAPAAAAVSCLVWCPAVVDFANGLASLASGGDTAAGTLLADAFDSAGDFGVRSTRELRKLIAGTDLEAHHLIEQRFAALFPESNPREWLAIALSDSEHQAFTNAWRRAIGYSGSSSAFVTETATRDLVLAEARRIYADYPEVLKALGLS